MTSLSDASSGDRLRAVGRSPLLVTALYLATGSVPVGYAGGDGQVTFTLAGWLLFSAALLYAVLTRASETAAALAAARAMEGQRAAEASLDTIMDALPDPLVVADEDGAIRECNQAAMTLLGSAADQPFTTLLGAVDAARLRDDWRDYLAGAPTDLLDRREVTARRTDGTTFPAEMTVAPLEHHGKARLIVMLRDASAGRKALERLRVAEKVLESTAEGVMVTDRRGTMLWVNAAFCAISGYGRDEVVGRNANMLKSGLQAAEFYAGMWSSIRATGEWAGEIWNRRKNGEAYPEWLTIKAVTDPAGQVVRHVGVFSDISKHKRAEETIRELTYYDAVTRLPNRHLFMDRLAQALERGQRNGRRAALVMIGLDRFRQINDSLGHQAGDHLLRAVAVRLAGCLRGHDTVARLRGDTFCCLLTDLIQDHDAHLVISRLLDGFTRAFELDGHELFVTARAGISVFPLDGNAPEDLVQKAETAMNRSREHAEAAYQYYAPEMHADAAGRLRLETELRKAATRGEFHLHYQPKIDTVTGRIAGAEALLRWTHSELGAVPPSHFIPVAEETGQIVALGQWVLDQVCGQLSQWREDGIPLAQIAVNLSALQFRQPDLIDRVVETLERHGIPPALLELELTEGSVMHDAEAAARTLARLHERGIGLAVDDFGTGYSSLSYLKRFPLDKLKIDRSFVADIHANPASAEIVGAIIALGHSLNLQIVAEGVEDDRQLAVLRSLHCDEIQGFYYSRPVPADTFAGLLRLGRCSP